MRISSLRRETYLLIVAAVALAVAGYVFFRYAYRVSDSFPFSQEIVLVLVGAILTVLITAILLNKQTEVELRKEESIKYLDLKVGIYTGLLDHLEQVVISGETRREDLIRLRFINHKVALVASPAVLEEFGRFVDTFMDVAEHPELLPGEADEILRALARLTIEIRRDLAGSDEGIGPVLDEEVERRIRANAKELEACSVDRGPADEP